MGARPEEVNGGNAQHDCDSNASSTPAGHHASPDAFHFIPRPRNVRPTPELSCEAPIVQGFVSFNSLLGGAVNPTTS
jgi:hypothetical protein